MHADSVELAQPDTRAAMQEALEQYLSASGLLEWRSAVAAADRICVPRDVGTALAYLSGIETDSRIIRKKLAIAGIDKDPVFQDFLITWMAEEAEHGRALAAIAMKAGAPALPPGRSRFKLWEVAAFAAMGAAVPQVIQASYCVIGAAAEFIALSTYAEIARCCGDETVKTVLLRISRQESRHMRFYRNVAFALLGDKKTAERARKLVRVAWRPPGVDLVGPGEHQGVFGFLLGRSAFREKLVKVDQIIDALPGMGEMNLMKHWLDMNLERYTSGSLP